MKVRLRSVAGVTLSQYDESISIECRKIFYLIVGFVDLPLKKSVRDVEMYEERIGSSSYITTVRTMDAVCICNECIGRLVHFSDEAGHLCHPRILIFADSKLVPIFVGVAKRFVNVNNSLF